MRWFFRSLHPIQNKKKGSIFHVVPIFTELGQDLICLAHKENTHSDIFLWDRQKIVTVFCSLIYYGIPPPTVETLTLWSLHTWLKNLGALSEYAKTISRYCPFQASVLRHHCIRECRIGLKGNSMKSRIFNLMHSKNCPPPPPPPWFICLTCSKRTLNTPANILILLNLYAGV